MERCSVRVGTLNRKKKNSGPRPWEKAFRFSGRLSFFDKDTYVDPMFHIWECREDEETARSADEEVIGIVIDWLHDEKQFEGTASELLEILHDALPCELRPNILSRWLNKHKGMLKANGVSYMLRRTRDSRTIRLSCDGNDANDDISWSGAASKIPSPSSQPSQAAALPGVSRQRPGTGRCPPLP